MRRLSRQHEPARIEGARAQRVQAHVWCARELAKLVTIHGAPACCPSLSGFAARMQRAYMVRAHGNFSEGCSLEMIGHQERRPDPDAHDRPCQILVRGALRVDLDDASALEVDVKSPCCCLCSASISGEPRRHILLAPTASRHSRMA